VFPLAHLHSLLFEVYLEGELLPEQYVWVVSFGEGFLQVLQLLLSEYCPVPPLPFAAAGPEVVPQAGTEGTRSEAVAGEEGAWVESGILRVTCGLGGKRRGCRYYKVNFVVYELINESLQFN